MISLKQTQMEWRGSWKKVPDRLGTTKTVTKDYLNPSSMTPCSSDFQFSPKSWWEINEYEC